MGPRNCQINLLGVLSGNDPVKNGRIEFTEKNFRSVMLVVTMVLGGGVSHPIKPIAQVLGISYPSWGPPP